MLERGARLFDAQSFWDAHEAWEEHWIAERDASRRLVLQGLIQVAAAFYKLLDKDQPASAARLFARGLAKLDAGPAALEGIDLAAFREATRACASRVGPGGGIDRSEVPKLLG